MEMVMAAVRVVVLAAVRVVVLAEARVADLVKVLAKATDSVFLDQENAAAFLLLAD